MAGARPRSDGRHSHVSANGISPLLVRDRSNSPGFCTQVLADRNKHPVFHPHKWDLHLIQSILGVGVALVVSPRYFAGLGAKDDVSTSFSCTHGVCLRDTWYCWGQGGIRIMRDDKYIGELSHGAIWIETLVGQVSLGH